MNALLIQTLLIVSILKLLVRSTRESNDDCARTEPMGMESGVIPDSHITSSSEAPGWPASAGRLYNVRAWCAARQSTGEWLQIDIGENSEFLAIAIEGTQDAWITGYYLLYSLDMIEWYCFTHNGTPKEMVASKYARIHVLYTRPVVRYIRINPTRWRNNICLKAEIYGCTLNRNRSISTETPKTCSYTPIVPPTSSLFNATMNKTNLTTTEATTEQITTTTLPPVILRPIDNVRIRPVQSVIKTGSDLSMSMLYHNGDSIKYKWDFGNGESIRRENNKAFYYAYKRPGRFQIRLLAYNDVSNATDSTYITVLDGINGLKFLSEIDPMVPNTTFSINWNIAQGTNVSYTIKFGDGSPAKFVNATSFGDGPYIIHHRYSKVAHFQISLQAVNLVSSAGPLHKIAIVEQAITGLNVQWVFPYRLKYDPKNIILAVGEEIKSIAKISSGSDPWFSFDFGERKIGNTSNSTISFEYSSTGSFTIGVKCFNHVSVLSHTYDLLIVVQEDEPITGLQILLSPTSIGNVTHIRLSMAAGTAFVCHWSLGDGFKTLTNALNANNSISHFYRSVGHFIVDICCENKHGNACADATAYVEIPLQKPNVTTSLKPLYTNESKVFNIFIKNGSDVTYSLEFGDGKPFKAHFPNTLARDKVFQVNHSFYSAGIYFVSLTAKNRLGEVRAEHAGPIIVQNPIRKDVISLMNNSPVKIPEGTVGFFLSYTTIFHTPTNISCLWHFGDSLVTRTSIPKTLEHSYRSQGNYRVVVSCANYVSIANISTLVVVYRMVTPHINISPTGKLVQHSLGPKRLYFATGANVTFCVTSQSFDLMYVWSGFDKNTKASDKPCINYVLQNPGHYTIKVLVNNSLEKMTITESLAVQDKISKLYLTSNGTYIIKSYVVFTWSAEEFGTDACYYLNLNDSVNDVIFGACDSQFHNAKGLVHSKTGANTYKYKYLKEGVYIVTLKGINTVSIQTASVKVVIRKPPCVVYNATITWNDKHNDTFTFLRSETFELRTRFDQNCVFAESFQIDWKFIKLFGNIKTNVQLSPIQMARKGFLSFRPLDLSYGTYRAEVYIRLTGKDIDTLYGEVSTSKSKIIEIAPSPLKAFIKGGPYRKIDPDYTFSLDAGGSTDPDEYIPTLNIRYRWYCKTFRQVLDKFVGCFADYIKPSDVVGYSRMLMLRPKEFIRNSTYVFTLEIYKGSRQATYQQAVFVTYGLPPSMEITCLMECKGLLIPSLTLVLLADCLSCSGSDVALNNKWEISRYVNKTLEPFQVLPSQIRYGLRTPRLEVLPNIFTPGEKYLVKLSAWKQGGLPGSTNYTFMAYKNTPPSSGNCSVNPKSGFAMDTTFRITCQGWLDRDTPLTYAFSYQIEEEPTLLYAGVKNKWHFKLPIKDGAENTTLNITADIQDSLGMSYATISSVLVQKPKSLDLSSIMDAIDKDISSGGSSNSSSSTQQERSVAEVVQLTNIISYKLNQASKTSKKTDSNGKIINDGDGNSNDSKSDELKRAEETKKAQEIRGKLTDQLSGVIDGLTSTNTTKVSDLDIVTNALRDVTREPKELSTASVNTVSKSLSDIALSLKSIIQSRSGSMTDTEKAKMVARVKTVAAKSIETVSNIMMATKFSSTSCVTSLEFNETSPKNVELLIKKVLETLDEVSIILLHSMDVGDPPYYHRTPFSNITLERNTAQSVSNKTFTGRLGSFKLPQTHDLLKNYNSSVPTVIDVQMMEFQNPYEYCKTSKNVTSLLVSLDLRRSDGTKYDISNTKKDIEITTSLVGQSKQEKELDFFNFSMGLSKTRFHAFNWTSVDSTVSIEFLPNTSFFQKLVKWNVYVTHSEQRLSTGREAMWSIHSSNTSRTIHVFRLTRDTHRYSDRFKIYVTVDLKEKPWKTQELNFSYRLGIYQSTCFYWDYLQNRFNTEGCRVGPKTDRKTTRCLCNHLTSFGSRLDTIPHCIGYDDELVTFLEDSVSPIVLSSVLVSLSIYIIILIWARNKDTEENAKGEILSLPDNNSSHRFKYEITVFTGTKNQAGTTANVCCKVRGEDGESPPRVLKDYHQQSFQRARIDAFLLSTAVHLGKLSFLELWHDNTGENPSWYVNKVTIRDVLKDHMYYFMCNRWLAVEHDDGKVSRTLPVAKKEEVAAFGHVFLSVSRKNLADRHLWLSLFKKPAKSRFTRVQRASCILALVYCVMLSNLIFYLTGFESDPSDTIQAGPLRLSGHQIGIGIISYLLMLPANLIIVGIFRYIKDKNHNDTNKEEKPNEAPLIIGQHDLISLLNWYKIAGQSEANLYKEACLHKSHEDKKFKETFMTTGKKMKFEMQRNIDEISALQKKKIVRSPSVNLGINEEIGQALQRKQKRQSVIRLPHYFVYLGWFYFIASSSVSAYLLVAYGGQFRNEKASQWLTSVFVSLIFDIIIIDGIKILIISLYFALVLKQPDEEDFGTQHEASNGMQMNYFVYPKTATYATVPLAPSNEELENARFKKLREIQMNVIIKDMMIYILFLASLLMVSYSHRDPQAFAVAQDMMNTYIGGIYVGNSLNEGDGTKNYWKWIEATVIPSLSSANRSWAPECNPPVDYDIGCNTRMIGTGRLRQLRIPPGTCKVPKDMQNATKTCNDFYSLFNEDKENYTEGWKWSNSTVDEPPNSPWHYQSMFDTGGYPYIGLMGTYSGGGYIFELSNTGEGLKTIKEKTWIDQYTRAILVEISVYNAQVDMFGIATFLSEWMPTNGVLFFNNVKAARLYIKADIKQAMTTACQVFLVLFLSYFIYGESKKVYRERKRYFKEIWNWFEINIIIFILGCLGALYQRSKFTAKAIEEMQENPNKYVSFIQAATFDELLTYFLGLVVFVANLKLLKLFRFNHRVYLFTRTLSNAKSPLLSFLLVFSIFYIAYCSIYYLIFGGSMYDYRSMVSTIASLFNILLGGFDFNSIEDADRVFGPILFFSFMLLMVMLLMNMFLTILMDAFAEVQGDVNLKENELEVFDYAMSRLNLFIKARKRGKVGNFPGENSSQEQIDTLPTTKDESGSETDEPGTDNNTETENEEDEEQDLYTEDALDLAIKRARLKVQLKQMKLLSRLLPSKTFGISGIPTCVKRTLDEKLVELTACFQCAALDDITLDRAYEEIFRKYVKITKNILYEKALKHQVEFALSWERPEMIYSPRPKNIYARYMMKN